MNKYPANNITNNKAIWKIDYPKIFFIIYLVTKAYFLL